jgi:glycosyltransferase involved in cell wall biosynthesis
MQIGGRFKLTNRMQVSSKIHVAESGCPLKVSVIIPVYNVEKYLSQAVESVVAERASGLLEIILVEDGSSDNSLEIAEKLKEKYAELIQLYRHPNGENRGAGASRNLGIQKAHGEYICFLDADDYWLPDRLKEAVSLLESDASIDGVYSPALYRFETAHEKVKFQHLPELYGTTETISPDRLLDRAIEGETVSHTNGFIIRRHCLDKTGLFEESLRRGQDTEFFYKMMAVLKLIGTASKAPVAVVRRHGENRWNPDNLQEELTVSLAVFHSLYRWSLEFPISARYKTKILKRLFFLLGCSEQFGEAWRIALNEKRPWFILFAWRYRFPGPKTIRRFFRWIFHS